MPIDKKDIDDRTIAEIWGQKPADQPPDKPTDKPVDKPTDKPADKPSDTPTPDKEATEKAVAAQKRIEKIMDEHDFEDFDELADALSNSDEFLKKLGNRDLDQLIKDADYLETMTRWQADVASQVKPSDDDSDDEDKKLTGLERQLKELQAFKDQVQQERDAKTKLEQSKEVLGNFGKLVTSTLEDQEIPEAHRPFVAEFLGVENPMLDVDLDNKVAVRKAIKGGLKKYNDFVTTIIKGYVDGKIKIPDITPTDTITPDKPETVKNLSHARSIAAEILSGKIFKK